MMPAKKVLIVEDEEILAANLKTYLDKALCDTRIAADGASAIRMAKAFCPDVLVLDFRLPDMSGFETLDAMRACAECVGCGCRCVLMTGHATGDFYSGAAQRGIEHILFKPFPLADLSSVICRVPANESLVRSSSRGLSHAGDALELDERRSWPEALHFPVRQFDGDWLLSERRRRVRHYEGNN